MGGVKRRFKSVFISDLHLGCSESRAEAARQFLKRVDCDTLYLVGDILDLWCLKGRWRWPEVNNRVINRLLKFAKRGTRVVYIPGNHDEAARRFAGLSFGEIEIRLEAVHETAKGERVLITHGDEFDLVVRHAPLLSIIGGHAYDWLLVLNRRYNVVRRWLGLEYWSLSKFLKMRVKSACTYMCRFEEAVADEARRRGFDAVVCGHVHKAEDRRINGVRYLNCGEWVEGNHAVVEHDNGDLELIDAQRLVNEIETEAARIEATKVESRRNAIAVETDEDDHWSVPEPMESILMSAAIPGVFDRRTVTSG